MQTMRFVALLALSMSLLAADPKVIVPANGVPPVGPYSPGLETGGYVYVSGQGVRDSKSQMPDGIEAQTKQCIENVRVILDAAGLKHHLQESGSLHIFLVSCSLRPLDRYPWMPPG